MILGNKNIQLVVDRVVMQQGIIPVCNMVVATVYPYAALHTLIAWFPLAQ